MRIPPPIITVAIVTAQRVAAAPRPGSPVAATLAAGALGLGAAALYAATLRAFYRAGTTIDPRAPEQTSALVTSGVFGVSRNPIYLADVLLVAAGAALTGRWWSWLGVPAFVAAIEPQLRAEERALTATFGADYADYRARVRRWL